MRKATKLQHNSAK